MAIHSCGLMYKGVRRRHTLGIEPTKANTRHAAGLRSTALLAAVPDPSYLRLLEPDGTGSLAFIAKQMGTTTMPCERLWSLDGFRFPVELERIREGMQNMAKAPKNGRTPIILD
jgi:hypothetical protein